MQSFSDWIQFAVSSAVVILFLLILLGLLLIYFKRSRRVEKTGFTVEHLNELWKTHEDQIRSAILPPKQLNALMKQRRKEEKEKSDTPMDKRKVFVLDFEGDITATECSGLRDAVSALLAIVQPRDEVVVRLESPGGVVHGYGLAASQLARLTDNKIRLTVCVDKVAASGGYMMACVADKIVAAPFSIIGSIGVLSATPNFNKLLKKHDVDYLEQTAGEYKRTVTMFGELNEAKKAKSQQNLDIIHGLFKDHVLQFRPQININTVATGEIWLGRHALNVGLVDEIKTSDDLLMSLAKDADVYLIKSERPQNWKTKLMKQMFGAWLKDFSFPLVRMNGKFF